MQRRYGLAVCNVVRRPRTLRLTPILHIDIFARRFMSDHAGGGASETIRYTEQDSDTSNIPRQLRRNALDRRPQLVIDGDKPRDFTPRVNRRGMVASTNATAGF